MISAKIQDMVVGGLRERVDSGGKVSLWSTGRQTDGESGEIYRHNFHEQINDDDDDDDDNDLING